MLQQKMKVRRQQQQGGGREGKGSPNSRRRSLMMKISISAKCNIEQRHFHQIISDTDQQAPMFPLLLLLFLLLPSLSPPLALHLPPLCPLLAQRAHLSVGTVLAIFISGRQQRRRRRHKMSVTCGLRASSPTAPTSPPPPRRALQLSQHCFSGYSCESSAHKLRIVQIARKIT